MAALLLCLLCCRLQAAPGHGDSQTLVSTAELHWAPMPGEPPYQPAPVLFYDPRVRRVVMLGEAPGGDKLSVCWEWDGVRWTPRSWTPPPVDRARARVAYDTHRGVAVVVTGNEELGGSLSTWESEGTVWTRRDTPVAPPARRGYSLAYDPGRGVTVLVAGENADGPFTDTWVWDGREWREVQFAGPVRGGRNKLLVDSSRQRLLACRSTGYDRGDLAEWDGMTWQILPGSTWPQISWGTSFGYDAGAATLLALDATPSTSNDRWDWDGHRWTKSPSHPPPPARRNAGIAWDESRLVLVVYGGDVGVNKQDTRVLEWDGRSWHAITPSVPPGRVSAAIAFDPGQSSVVVHGGFSIGGVCGDTWLLRGQSWERVESTSAPSPRFQAAAATDCMTGVLLFGGRVSTGLPYPGELRSSDETWRFQARQWVLTTPAHHPSGRYGHAMALGGHPRKLLLTGGRDGARFHDETWEWNGSDWALLGPGPGPRAYHGMAWCPEAGRFLVFGGFSSDKGEPLADTWVLENGAWRKLEPRHSPPARGQPSLVHDPALRGLLLCGGRAQRCDWLDDPRHLAFKQATSVPPESWVWDGRDWQPCPGFPPGRRVHFSMVHSPAHAASLLFGGWSREAYLGDLWCVTASANR